MKYLKSFLDLARQVSKDGLISSIELGKKDCISLVEYIDKLKSEKIDTEDQLK